MGKPGRVTIENAEIIFRNFAGKEGMYNKAGDRNFCVFIDDPKIEKDLKQDGWNVKYTKPRDEDDTERPYLKVNVKYAHRPPTVVLINSRGRTDLTESEVEVLDWIDVKHIDLIITPYEWEWGGKSGVAAYLKSLFVTMDENELDRKYADVPYANEDPFPEGNNGPGVDDEEVSF